MSKSIKVEKTVTVNRPAAELYHFWHNFNNIPTFMKNINYVEVIDDKRLRWSAKVPMASSIEWDAEITDDRENKLIAWTSVAGAEVDNSGCVEFHPIASGNATKVKFTTEYKPPGGIVGATIAKLFSKIPEQQVTDALRNFKALMEGGRVTNTEGQP